MQRVKKIGEFKIIVTPHRSLNYVRGVVKCKDLTICTTEEIMEELKPQGVVGCSNITIRLDLQATVARPVHSS